MIPTEISDARLRNQQIAAHQFKSVRDVVGWMGAVQAQDYSMAKWAIGVRLPGSTDRTVEEAFNDGEILRTHLLRPTLHLVSSGDIYWILNLTAPVIKNSLKFRYRELELPESIFQKTNKIITAALKGENHLTRDELLSKLNKARINTVGQRGYHILVRAELDGFVCSGRLKGKLQTYALLEERVSESVSYSKEEGLEKLARIYFNSRGPASIKDFKWWSGLPGADVSKALEMIKDELVRSDGGPEVLWKFNNKQSPMDSGNSTFLLPAFDEFLISYKDRSASLPFVNFKKAVSENGIFRPVIVSDGQVIGTWRRTIRKEKVIMETDFFKQNNRSLQKLIAKNIEKFGLFIGKRTETG